MTYNVPTPAVKIVSPVLPGSKIEIRPNLSYISSLVVARV